MNSRTESGTNYLNGFQNEAQKRNFEYENGNIGRGGGGGEKEISFFGNDFEVMPIMNKLYDVLRDVILEGFDGVHLPSLVVCGDQSQGKTSVLESIVKREFLPKGDQIQTRCPIEVQLVHISRDVDSEGYAEILNEDDQTWTFLRDMQQVRNAIQERTDKIRGSCPAGVSDKRTVVKVYSPDVPDLTLVDLPGFLNVSTAGQNEEITAKIKEVVRKELDNPNCIILAVTAAGNNIGTSTALKEALRADPERERTLGIITKLDLMDKGTNCEDVLRGNQYKLKLGFVGCVCRNFEDNARNKSIEEKIKEEKMFLEKNYPNIANRNGIPHLTKTISQLLLQRIYHTLPGVRMNIEKLIQAYRSRLSDFGNVVESHDRRKMLVNYLERFRDAFKAQIDGNRRGIAKDSLAASAKIQAIYRNLLRTTELDVMGGVTNQEIDRCIKNSHALHNMMFLTVDDAFQEFARAEVGRLRPPIIDCAQQVNAVMIEAIRMCCATEAEMYPKLNNSIAIVATDVINDCFRVCKDYLENFMNAEEALVYSSEPNFMDQLRAEPSAKDKSQSKGDNVSLNGELMDKEFGVSDPIYSKAREDVRRMVRNYLEIVKHRAKDHAPKAISNLLVYQVSKSIGEALCLQLDTVENAEELMKESVIVQRDRAAIQERLDKFTKAKEIINEVLKAVSV